MGDGKILIMGVGGCGSGFLWKLLDDCGLETFGINEWMRHSGIRQAVKEGVHAEFKSPKVIKHLGGFLTNLNYHIDQHNWEVEHIFFAVASLSMQMQSFRERTRRGPFDYDTYLDKYRHQLGMGLIQLIERDHPFSLIECPRSLSDSKYCYNKLKIVLPDTSYEEFAEIHKARVNPVRLKNRIKGLEEQHD